MMLNGMMDDGLQANACCSSWISFWSRTASFVSLTKTAKAFWGGENRQDSAILVREAN